MKMEYTDKQEHPKSLTVVKMNHILLIILLMSSTLQGLPLNNCTRVVLSCPLSEEAWIKRSKEFNCTQYNYACIKTFYNTLVECCIPANRVNQGTGNCPAVNVCDEKYQYPLLVEESRFKLCPEEIQHCPRKSHSLYTVNELYKYPACLVKKFSELWTFLGYSRKPSEFKTEYTSKRKLALTVPQSEYTVAITKMPRVPSKTPLLQNEPDRGETVIISYYSHSDAVILLIILFIIIAIYFLWKKILDFNQNEEANGETQNSDNGKKMKTLYKNDDIESGLTKFEITRKDYTFQSATHGLVKCSQGSNDHPSEFIEFQKKMYLIDETHDDNQEMT